MTYENAELLEQSAVLAILPPVAATAARTSPYVTPHLYSALEAKVLVGIATATATLTILRASGTDGAGAVTESTYAFGGSAGSGKLHRLTLFPRELGAGLLAERPYYAIELGAGVANTAVIIEAFGPKYEPPSSGDDVILGGLWPLP